MDPFESGSVRSLPSRAFAFRLPFVCRPFVVSEDLGLSFDCGSSLQFNTCTDRRGIEANSAGCPGLIAIL